jgi:FAD synthetase
LIGIILLHLLAACLYRRHQASPPTDGYLYPPIPAIYISAESPFPELEQFVWDSAAYYNLDLVTFGGEMKEALGQYLECEVGKGTKAIMVGTRRTDPHGGKSPLLLLA